MIVQCVDSNLPGPPSSFRFAASNDPCPEIDGTLPTRRVIFFKRKGRQSVNRKGKLSIGETLNFLDTFSNHLYNLESRLE